MEFDIWHIARYGTLDEMKTAIKKGVDINEKDEEFGNTSLNTAIAYDNIEMALLLLENGADVNAQDNNGLNALHYAADHNMISVAQAILELSTDPLHVEDKYTAQPLYKALMRACEPYAMVQLFLDKGADKTHGYNLDLVKMKNHDNLTKFLERY